jgi:hypothetical protein
MVECLTCGGRYEPLLPDGLQYFHACPPLAVHEIEAGLDAGTIILSRADAARLQAAKDADAANAVAAGEPTREDLTLATFVIERPEKRDENVRPGAADKRPEDRIKAAGRGVVAVARDAATDAGDPPPTRSVAR